MKSLDGWVINEWPALYYELTSFFSIIKMEAHAFPEKKNRESGHFSSGLISQHNFDNINKKYKRMEKKK